MVTKPWSERKQDDGAAPDGVVGTLSKIPGVRVIPLIPPPLPGGGDFPVDLVIASTAEPQQLVEFANQLVGKAFASGLFMFADADLKFDQPQAEVVFDRDKVRSQGVDLSQAGQDLSTLLGGDYVNRFSIQGRSYKVIPQMKRSERLTPDQLADIHVTGPDGKLVPLSTFATLETSTEPRELKRFQQLNAVRIQGVIPPRVSLDQALAFLEDEAAGILPRASPSTTPASRASSAPRAASSSARSCSRRSSSTWCWPRSSRASAIPFIILAGSVPLAICGRAALLVPGLHHAQHLQPGRPHHPGRPRRQERHPDRGVREPPAGDGQDKLQRDRRGLGHAPAADPDDDRGHRGRPLPARARHRARAPARATASASCWSPA